MGLRLGFRFRALVLVASGYAHASSCEVGGAPVAMRLISVKRDAVLHSKWGLMVDCAHPERPSRWVLLGEETATELKVEVKAQSTASAVPGPMVMRAGETVRVWQRVGMASIETSGIAEQSGVVGARIQVRLMRRGVDGESVERHVSGVVDGVGSAELR